MTGDTIFALSSGRPPAAIGVIRISGSLAHDAGRRLAGDLPPARGLALRELRHPSGGETLDTAIILRFDAPASATGENLVELHVHGGRAVTDAVLAALASVSGLREAQPGEFTRRAFENGRIDLTEAEGLADLLEAESEAQRKAALAIAQGGLRQQIARWQQQLLDLSARAEAAIDYADEVEEEVDAALKRDCAAFASNLAEWIDRPLVEPLRDGVRVVVAGPPNAGKSSLINAISGIDRAIVTAIPGTTRDHIEVPLSLAGIPILLTDTAGLRASDDPVERIGIGRAEALVEAADVLVWLGEPRVAPAHPRTILVHARADLSDRALVPTGSLPVSSRTGRGIADLLGAIQQHARTLIPTDDAISLNRRQAALVEEACQSVRGAASSGDLVIIADELRHARSAFDRMTGRAGVEDLLDSLFGRFCLGK